jgi:hypothetical protein
LQIVRDIIDIFGLELGDDDWLGFFERASVASATAMVTASTVSAVSTASSAVSSAVPSAIPSSSSAAIAMLGPVQIDVDLSSFFNGCGKGHQTNECDLIINSQYNKIKIDFQ